MTRNLNDLMIWKKQSDGSFNSPPYGDNYVNIASDGVMTFSGDAKRKITFRPTLNYTSIVARGKPTQIIYGAYSGYSLPVYNSDNEELFFKMKVPERWDGETNPRIVICIWLGGNEDVGDKFNIQASYQSCSCGSGGSVLNTTYDVPSQITILTDRNTQYSIYEIEFELNASYIAISDVLSFRMRRIAASDHECTNEIVVFNVQVEYQRDKMGGEF